MSTISTTLGHAGRASPPASTTWHSAFDVVRLWLRRSRERAELARFSERDLRDIGITVSDVQWEINKPFWRP
ncbi:MAG TPA: DUF1127 domain-containing protein [Vineibacter sp.]|nr:DUF1127 domain-containing protein [Vineibacter sp.]